MTNFEYLKTLDVNAFVQTIRTPSYCKADFPEQCGKAEWRDMLSPCGICFLLWLEEERIF